MKKVLSILIVLVLAVTFTSGSFLRQLIELLQLCSQMRQVNHQLG